ncbi:DUF5590 domain-containing protein [Lacticaseibacillus parakribbianus]|uniref:cell wall elongation regulator TseB-like domain-containing protein n=1 Tax=Lacticaseibacillus parakribbianus TaxID=2970927 RepID=UPI0021CB3C8E|nr:DUF5590 domain-containing protein [Lacticaseibacillus parakribbianus]
MRPANRRRMFRLLRLIAGIALLAAVVFVWTKSVSPLRSVREQAAAIAKRQAKVTTVSQFYWDTQRDSYLTVAGTTTDHRAVYVVIRQKTGKVHVLRQSAGITRQQALAKVAASYAPKRISSIGLSRRAKKFVWDIGYRTKSGKLGYVTYDFATGEELAAIRNL